MPLAAWSGEESAVAEARGGGGTEWAIIGALRVSGGHMSQQEIMLNILRYT